MREDFVPLLLLVIAPLAWLARQTGLFGTPVLRGAATFFLVAIVLLNLPLGGVTLPYIERMSLLLCAVVSIVMWFRYLGLSPWTEPRTLRSVLLVCAPLAVLAYYNFFSFHGARIFMHDHDTAHYYLGSKYFPEIGYGDLYAAMLAAEAEHYEDHFVTLEARNLRTNRIVHIGELLGRSGELRERFSPDRWSEFRKDVSYFRDRMGPRYGKILQDHGFNPTPVWALIGGFLANRVPGGDPNGIGLLTLIDPALVGAVFLAVGWAFGLETALLALIYYCVIYGATFDWIGGAYLRTLWFASTMLAACCLRRDQYAAAGAFLAVASALRIFPALFAAGLLFRAVGERVRTGRTPRRHVAFFTAALVTGLVLVGATMARPGGVQRWIEFRENLSVHSESASSNFLGLTSVLAYTQRIDPEGVGGVDRLMEARRRARYLQLATVFLLAVLLVARMSQQASDLEAMAMGVLLLMTGFNLSAYYYVFLLLLLLAHTGDPRKVAFLFGAELVTYTLNLFEEHAVMLYLYRSVVLFYMVVALYGDRIRIELLRVRQAFTGARAT